VTAAWEFDLQKRAGRAETGGRQGNRHGAGRSHQGVVLAFTPPHGVRADRTRSGRAPGSRAGMATIIFRDFRRAACSPMTLGPRSRRAQSSRRKKVCAHNSRTTRRMPVLQRRETSVADRVRPDAATIRRFHRENAASGRACGAKKNYAPKIVSMGRPRPGRGAASAGCSRRGRSRSIRET